MRLLRGQPDSFLRHPSNYSTGEIEIETPPLRTGAAKNPWEPIFSIFRFRALRARTYFLPKFPPIFTREPIFYQNFLRAAREPILVFFMYDFAPKIHGKLKIPKFSSRASRANLFFSILKI